MAKVLIASIGTGVSYNPENPTQITYSIANYEKEGEVYKSPYFFKAAIHFYGIDKIILIGTCTSNWENLYRYIITNGGRQETGITEDEFITWGELEEFQKKFNHNTELCEYPTYLLEKIEQVLPEGSKVILTRYGLDDTENAENFTILTRLESIFNDGDELYFDITHSFRSLPMYQFLIIQYLKNISRKKVNVKNILYGMYEVRKEFEGITPVVELNQFNTLTEWTYAAYEFKTYGSTLAMERLLEKGDLVESPAREIRQLLKRINATLNFNQYAEFLETMERVKKCLSGGSLDALTPTVANIIRTVFEDFLSLFNNKKNEYFQFEITKLHYNQHRYGLATIALEETMISFMCVAKRISFSSYRNRENMKDFLRFHLDGSYLEWCLGSSRAQELIRLYDKNRRLRNNTAHFSTEETGYNILDFKENLRLHIESFENMIKNDDLRWYINKNIKL